MTKTKRHGFSLGMERAGDEFFLSMRVTGRLTHSDYQAIVPFIDSAIEGVAQPHIDAFVDCTDLEGWEPRAAWDDLKLGLRHRREFRRIAIVGRKGWHELAAKVGGWFIFNSIAYFEDEAEAYEWLKEPAASQSAP